MKRHPLFATVADLPELPGVYQFLDAKGTILYVGKAINLRSRVKSYFANDTGRGPVIEEMVGLATTIQTIPTDSELEAIILEASLIRKLKPKYNSMGKDDKSSFYIVVERADQFPRIHLMRGQDLLVRRQSKQIKGARFYGPYVGVGNMRSVVKAIRRIWPHRDCSEAKFARYQKMGRGCLFAQLGLCPAPCVNPGVETEYAKTVRQIEAFLAGRRQGLLEELRSDMAALADKGQYEAAAVVRDRLFALENMRHLISRGLLEGQGDRKERIANGLVVEAYDISNIQGEYAVGVLVRSVLPRDKSGTVASTPSDIVLTRERYRKFKIKWVEGANDPQMLAEVLTRRFRRALKEPVAWSLPDIILVDGGTTQLAAARQVAKSLGIPTPIVAVAKGPTRKKVDLYVRPADEKRLPLKHLALQKVALLMREEAHRYAINYYRSLHRRALVPKKG